MKTAYLSLGSNQGERRGFLHKAVDMLHGEESITVVDVSSIYETDPVGYEDQPAFLNLALKARTSLEPHALLSACQKVEAALGRVRTIRWGPRTIDIDILLYEDVVLDSETLTLPHPRMHERAFVLTPLAEIAPELAIGSENVRQAAERVRMDPAQGIRLAFPAPDWTSG